MSQQPPNQLLTLPGLSGGDANDVAPASLPWWRRPRVIIGIAIALLIIIIGGVLFSIINRKAPATYQTQQVTQGDLSLTINATGPIASSVYNLVFQGTGKIAELDAKQGQKVTKGQVLARLDKTSLQDALNTAQSNLDSDRSALNTALANAGAAGGSYAAGVSAAQTAVGVNANNQGATTGSSNASVSAAQAALDNAQKNLDSTQRTANASKSQAQAKLQSDLNACSVSATATAQSTTTAATTTATNTKNASATAAAAGTATASENAEATALAVTPTPKNAFINPKGPSTTSYFSDFANFSTFSDCEQLARQTYNSSVATADASVTTAENAVTTAETGLTSAQATGNQSITSSTGQVTTSSAAVTTAKTSTGAVTAEGQVASAESTLALGVVNLATAQHNLDQATLTAPHDGTITTVNGTVGGTPGVPTSTGTTATTSGTFIQIVDLNSLQVQANVNESDTANLKIGDPAVFTVNAYPNRTFNGTVSGISPNGVTVSNVVTYPVLIDVDIKSANGANLLPNMTANATVTVVQRKNVPQISVNAINFARLASSGSTASTTTQLITRQAANSATAQARQMLGSLEAQNPNVTADSPIPAFVIERSSSGTFVAKPVVLGLTDGTNYEVLEGLSPGETYIVGTGSSTTRTTTTSTSGG